VQFKETAYGEIQVDDDGKAVQGSVFRFVEFPGAGGLQVEILSGLAQGMCRLVGSIEEAHAALTAMGLQQLDAEGPQRNQAVASS
jgi:hypothetical protein